MNPIFYTSKQSGDSFKLVFMTEDKDEVDLLLDQLNDSVENTSPKLSF